jgi:hypothetical protein
VIIKTKTARRCDLTKQKQPAGVINKTKTPRDHVARAHRHAAFFATIFLKIAVKTQRTGG